MKAKLLKQPGEIIKQEHNLSGTLSKLMEEAKLKDSDLSRFTGVPQSTLIKLRTLSNTNPTVETLLPIANFFGLTIQQLLGLEAIGKPTGSFVPEYRKSKVIPILSLAETLDWPNSKKAIENDSLRGWIETGADISDEAFSIMSSGSMTAGRYPEKANMIFDVNAELKDRDIVVVLFENRNQPMLRQVIIDSDDIYFKSFNPELEKIIYDEKFKILGIMKQVIINT